MANIDDFFGALEKEGLYNGRIKIAGKEHRFPRKAESSRNFREKSTIAFAKIIRFSSLIIILILVGYVFINLLIKNRPTPETPPPVKIADPANLAAAEQEREAAEIPKKIDTGVKNEKRVLAGITFSPVNSGEYSFAYISQKIFLHKIKTKSADIRLILNDIIDRVNKEAVKTGSEAFVLTPRFVTKKHLLKLWLDGYLEKGQIFVSIREGAVSVKKTNSGSVKTNKISDWKTLSKNKKIFTRIILKKSGGLNQ